MEIELEERIRQRAYELWEDAGRPEGGAEHFWHQAERDITSQPQSGSDPLAVPRLD